MGRLTEHDLTNVTAFLRTSLAGTIADPLPRPLLVELRDLTGADEAEYFEMRRTDRSVVAAARSHDWSDPAWMDEAIAANGHENPLGWRRWGPSDGAVRLSARVS